MLRRLRPSVLCSIAAVVFAPTMLATGPLSTETESESIAWMLELGPDLSSSLGLEITDDAAAQALELFEIDKFDEAIKTLDDITLDRVNKDQERNRELKLMAGILTARSGTKNCLVKANQRFSAAKSGTDKRGTALKAAVAQTAAVQSPKDGTDGVPKLKSKEQWLAAIDLAREFYNKQLEKEQTKFGPKISGCKFNETETVAKTCGEKMEHINIIRHQPEKNREIAKKYTTTLRETRRSIDLKVRELRGEIRSLEIEIAGIQGSNAAMESKRRQLNKKITSKEKEIIEADKASAFLATEITKFSN